MPRIRNVVSVHALVVAQLLLVPRESIGTGAFLVLGLAMDMCKM